jgi:ABC-type polysaccharide/polyol phosphate transport system ATPase subunit
MKTAISVNNVTKSYQLFDKDYQILKWVFLHQNIGSNKLVLSDISFTISPGEIVGVIGKNGAGKSTLMKLIANISFPDKGQIYTNGIVTSFINLGAGFNSEYTGRQNIYYKADLMGINRLQINDVISEIYNFSEIGEYFDLPLKTYSSGMRARLGFSFAVFLNPDIILLDEVFSVGDRDFKQKSANKMREMFESDKTILFSSHSDNLISQLCTRVIYLRDGKIAYDGTDIEYGVNMYAQEGK